MSRAELAGDGDGLTPTSTITTTMNENGNLEIEIPPASPTPTPPPNSFTSTSDLSVPSKDSPTPHGDAIPLSPVPDGDPVALKSPRRKSVEESKFEHQRRKSFVYEQISDKNKTSLMKSQFSRKATVKVTTSCDCIIEQGKTVRVNDYYFLKTLGKGAYGEVKLATKDLMEDDFGRKHDRYAIKMMKREGMSDNKRNFAYRRSSGGNSLGPERSPSRDEDEDTKALQHIPEAMLQEIAIMKMLVHPNLVNLLEIINAEDSKFVYLVLEHIEGGTIMGYDEDTGRYVYRLTGRVMGEATASRTFKDLISALSYLHANHIAHRDIKPDNLLVNFNGQLKLSDFGVSSHFENDRKKSSISLVALARSKSRGAVSKTEGTFSFYSPEMCTVKTMQGYSAYMADMWAATVCLWIFIFGRVPFYHPEVMTLFQMIREEDPVMPHVVSPELDHLLKICLQKDVTLRPSAVTVRHHCWLTQEPLSGYLKAQAGDDSGDEGNEATELLEMNEIEFETRDIIPLRCVLRLRKLARRAREKCDSRREEFVYKANIEMNLLVRKAQRTLGTTLEEDEDEDSLDDLSVDSDDSDPLGRVVSFMEDVVVPTPRNANATSKSALETNSDEEADTPPRKSMTDSIRKSFQKFTNVKLDESDEEGADNADAEGEEEEKPTRSFFFCCA